MKPYIALLRGINVGGKVVKMEALRNVFNEMGFENVTTYIQSGNVLFSAVEEQADGLAAHISEKLQEAFGFPIPVIIRTVEEWSEVIQANPFAGQEPYVTFLDAKPEQNAIFALEIFAEDFEEEVRVIGREVYLICPKGYGKTKLSNALFEKKLGVSGTTRNWKTVNKLLSLCQK
ncbi:MAG TPA: DUF1697 domain-containing protein [Bacillales bacterium]|nr:DUF1697 domain-containing protein [Bacillales bacterium]